jgi:hypothetical protein
MTPRDYTARLSALAEPLTMADPFRPVRNAAMTVCAAHDEADLVDAGQACGDVIAHLETAAAEIEAAAMAMRAALAEVMNDTGMTQVRTKAGTWHIREASPRVVITDEALIPPSLMDQPPPRPHRTAIARALKAGIAIPGATLTNGGPHVLAFRPREGNKP